MSDAAPLLDFAGLTVTYRVGGVRIVALDGLDLQIAAGETVGIVGESGSGKSTLAMAMLRYLDANGGVAGGAVRFKGRDLAAMSATDLRRLRGGGIGMVYQDPAAALNPSLRLGVQLAEVPMQHLGLGRAEADAAARAALDDVQLTDRSVMDAYPFELSGGQRQRAVIAMALLARPDILVLDEPTASLDAPLEAEIAALLGRLAERDGMAMLLISHNLRLVGAVCRRAVVLHGGRKIEDGPCAQVFSAPHHPYTRQLVEAGFAPPPRRAPPPPDGAPVLTVKDLGKTYGPGGLRALDGVSFDIGAGETVAVVGPSGSGKSTLAGILMGLIDGADGQALFGGHDVARLAVRARPPAVLRGLQMVFQDPAGTLNPSYAVGGQVMRAAARLSGVRDRTVLRAAAAQLMQAVGLTAEMLQRLPAELSGGQVQRVAIARALAASAVPGPDRTPALLIADEPVSALDATVQTAILDLMSDLQQRTGTAVLFITHDLALARRAAHRVIVMDGGRIVEQGPTEKIFSEPAQTFTRFLLAARLI